MSDDAFRIFVSHKHEDHDLAMVVKEQLEGLMTVEAADRPIECFVSGADIVAATDWDSTIRRALDRSHLLLLLFTNSSHRWDWCLYETGLFTRFDTAEVHAVACLHADGGAPPGPLGSVQAVPMGLDSVTKFVKHLCYETHEMSDNWRRGPLAKDGDIEERHMKKVAKTMVDAFNKTLAGVEGYYYPCHRVVLDVGTADDESGIPMDGRVVVGVGQTSSFTLSLFGYGSVPPNCTWEDILTHLDAIEADWRKELDRAYENALKGKLFTPVCATLTAWDDQGNTSRSYKPLLYEIQRRSGDRKPVSVTIVFDRLPDGG